jgi:hypothetical protein
VAGEQQEDVAPLIDQEVVVKEQVVVVPLEGQRVGRLRQKSRAQT